MKSARIVKPKESLEVQQLETQPRGSQILIKVGVCHNDIYLWEGGYKCLGQFLKTTDRGVKKSGFGRELSRYGMQEFVNIKSVRFYDQLIHNHHVE